MISASSLARNCRHDQVLKARKPRPASTEEAAARGTVFHKAVEAWLHDGAVPSVDDLEIQGWVDLLASEWIPPASASCEIAWGLDAQGGYVDVDEPEPHVYVAKDGRPLLTAGRADVAFEWRGVLYVFDWKTGRWAVTPAIANLQVHAAGIALAQRFGAVSYRPAIYYVRDGAWDDGEEVPLGSAAHAAMLAEVHAAATLDNEPHPGPHCARCWERKACPQVQR